MSHKKERHTYEGISSTFEDASIVICGIPFDGTCSNRPGTRFGPMELRKEIDGLETYSPYQNKDLEDLSICDIGDIELPLGNTKKTIDDIYSFIEELLHDDKKVLSIGGEHLVSFPIVKAYINKYPELNIVHLDAHTDLREDYLGEQLSHATVIKRIYDELINGEIFQFGIRSGTREEFDFGRSHTNLKFNTLKGMEQLKEKIGHKPVYITLDLDVLDPSIMPGTGTPSPGGVGFNQLLEGLISLSGLNIVGADIVELSPHYDASGVSNVVAAKLLREIVLLMGTKE